jgi:hypothetical protein
MGLQSQGCSHRVQMRGFQWEGSRYRVPIGWFLSEGCCERVPVRGGYSLGNSLSEVTIRGFSYDQGSVTIKFRSLTIKFRFNKTKFKLRLRTCAIIDCVFAVRVSARPPIPSKWDQSTLVGPAQVNRVRICMGDKSTWAEFDKISEQQSHTDVESRIASRSQDNTQYMQNGKKCHLGLLPSACSID